MSKSSFNLYVFGLFTSNTTVLFWTMHFLKIYPNVCPTCCRNFWVDTRHFLIMPFPYTKTSSSNVLVDPLNIEYVTPPDGLFSERPILVIIQQFYTILSLKIQLCCYVFLQSFLIFSLYYSNNIQVFLGLSLFLIIIFPDILLDYIEI